MTTTCQPAIATTNRRKALTSCPETRRVNHRRNEQSKWRRSARWKVFVREHTVGKICERCGKTHGEVRRDRHGTARVNKRGEEIRVILTINHTSRRKYISLEEYCTWDEDCEVCCTVCNWMYEKARVPCPKCRTVYIRWDESMCLTCYLEEHPEERAKFDAAKEQKEIDRKLRAKQNRAKKAMHKFPCSRRGMHQKCRRKHGEVCTYSARTWQKCKYAKGKAQAEKVKIWKKKNGVP